MKMLLGNKVRVCFIQYSQFEFDECVTVPPTVYLYINTDFALNEIVSDFVLIPYHGYAKTLLLFTLFLSLN